MCIHLYLPSADQDNNKAQRCFKTIPTMAFMALNADDGLHAFILGSAAVIRKSIDNQ